MPFEQATSHFERALDTAMRGGPMGFPGQSIPHAVTIFVGPEEAAAMLRFNTPTCDRKNRNIGKAKVAEYANTMRVGLWKLNGEALKFSRTRLLDGQHRLSAVIQSGVAVPMLILFGLDEDAVDTMDDGKRRKLSDKLAMRNTENANVIAAAMPVAINLLNRKASVLHGEDGHASYMDAYFKERIAPFAVIDDIVTTTDRIYRKTGKAVYPAITAAFLLWAHANSPRHAAAFAERMSGVGIDDFETDVVARFIARSRAEHANKTADRMSELAMLCRAWDAWMTGRTLTRFFSKTRENKFPFPTTPNPNIDPPTNTTARLFGVETE